jgi:hypothetical protein
MRGRTKGEGIEVAIIAVLADGGEAGASADDVKSKAIFFYYFFFLVRN